MFYEIMNTDGKHVQASKFVKKRHFVGLGPPFEVWTTAVPWRLFLVVV